jgi:hypothetical protein
MVRDDENEQHFIFVSVRAPSALFGVNPVLAYISVSVLMTKAILRCLNWGSRNVSVAVRIVFNTYTPCLSNLYR